VSRRNQAAIKRYDWTAASRRKWTVDGKFDQAEGGE